jgi:hypothetical protein
MGCCYGWQRDRLEKNEGKVEGLSARVQKVILEDQFVKWGKANFS